MTTETQDVDPKFKPVSVLSWFVGAAVGWYSVIHLLIPTVFTILFWIWAQKTFAESKKSLIPALGVQFGQAAWMAIGAVLLSVLGQGAVNEIQIVEQILLSAGLLWLFFRPSRKVLYLLSGYQAFGLVINGIGLVSNEIGSVEHRALVVHVIWRSLALFHMIQLIRKRPWLPTQPAVTSE